MLEQLFQSHLGRAKAGYRWVQAVPHPNLTQRYPDWFLTDGAPVGTLPPQESFGPLDDNPQLFLEFSQIDYFQDSEGVFLPEIDPDCQTSDSIRGFANRYGLLTRGEPIAIPEDPLTTTLVGEARFLWEEQIEKMKHAVDMWAMVSPKVNTERLQQVIRWQPDNVVSYKPSGYWGKK